MHIAVPFLTLTISVLAVVPRHELPPSGAAGDVPSLRMLHMTKTRMAVAASEGTRTSMMHIPLLTAIVVFSLSLVIILIGCFLIVWHLSSGKKTRESGNDASLLPNGDAAPPASSFEFSEWLALMAMPCVALIAQVCLLAYVFFHDDVGQKELPQILFYSAITFIVCRLIFLVVGAAKNVWLRALGMNSAEIASVFSPDQFDRGLVAKYGDGRIMIVDGVIRKSGHIILWTFCMALPFLIPITFILPVTIIGGMGGLVNMTVTVALVNSSGFFSTYMCFPYARFRDGRLRRWNLIGVYAVDTISFSFSVFMWRAVCHEGLIVRAASRKAILWVVNSPCFIGDAMAEIVGVLFGYHRFPVLGVGEINNKSVEGCLGMFASSCLYSFAGIYWLEQQLSRWWILIIVINLVGVVMETFTPRGFDNCTIPTSAFLCVTIALYMGWNPDA